MKEDLNTKIEKEMEKIGKTIKDLTIENISQEENCTPSTYGVDGFLIVETKTTILYKIK